MYLPKIVDTVLVREVKKFFEGLNYKLSILKGEITTTINVDCKWIKCRWNETVALGLDFLKPIKISELLAPVLGYIYSKFPEMEKEIKEILKEIDKKFFLTEGAIKAFKQQWETNRFTIEYADKKLVISQACNENYCEFTIDEELLCEILKIAANSKHEQEGVQDFVYSILPTSMQEIIMTRLKADYEEIHSYTLDKEFEKLEDENPNIEVDSTNYNKWIVKVNSEKKYTFEIKKNKVYVSINGKPSFNTNKMSEVIAFIEDIIE